MPFSILYTLYIYISIYLLTSKTSIKRFATSKRLNPNVFIYTRGAWLGAASERGAEAPRSASRFLWKKSVSQSVAEGAPSRAGGRAAQRCCHHEQAEPALFSAAAP